MSGVPGFSVSDLISAVAWTIEFIIALKSVRGEVKELRKSLETASSELNGLEDLLKKRQNRIEGPIQFRTAALNALRTDLHGILNDIFSFLKRFDPQGASKPAPFSNFRQNVRWVVDSRYSGTVKDLLRRLSEYRPSVNTELLLCMYVLFERASLAYIRTYNRIDTTINFQRSVGENLYPLLPSQLSRQTPYRPLTKRQGHLHHQFQLHPSQQQSISLSQAPRRYYRRLKISRASCNQSMPPPLRLLRRPS
jgi:uncharacterized protein YoxC